MPSPVGRGEMKWETFQRVIEGHEAIVLVADTVMYVFPKRAFTSTELEEFKELIAAHVPVWGRHNENDPPAIRPSYVPVIFVRISSGNR